MATSTMPGHRAHCASSGDSLKTTRNLREAVSRNSDLVAAATLAVLTGLFIWFCCTSLSAPGRISLIVLEAAILGWAITGISDTIIGLAAVSALGVTGVVEPDALYASLGDEFIWLLVAAFVMSAVLRKSGLIERMMAIATARIDALRQLFTALTLLISATAFVIPSTSARAALLLPVYLALSERISSPDARRALALLFPTVILLSAGGSLIGAGAHAVAAGYIGAETGAVINPFDWALAALPFALATSFVASSVILRLFVPRAARTQSLQRVETTRTPMPVIERQLAAIALLMVGGWMTTAWHGLSTGIIGLLGIAFLLLCAGPLMKPKDAFRAVEVELIVFLATTFVIVDALTKHGVDTWLAGILLASLPAWLTGSTLLVVSIVAVVALASHLLITSRTARATVLIPAFVLPLAAMGHDAKLLIMVTILGTGFCQTLPASAKPVALFSNLDQPTYSSADLMRLSMVLFPLMFAVLVPYALAVW